MEVEVSATGKFRDFIPEKKKITVNEGTSLSELKTICGITNKGGIGFVVNGKMAKFDYLVKNGDVVQFIMVVGAG